MYCLKLNVGTLHMTEFLVVIAAVRHFRHHLLGATFRLRTDHQPLQFVTNAKDPWGRSARWIAELQEYDFEMEFIDGRDNLVADALSRLEFGRVRVIHSIGLPTSWSPEVYCKAQNKDPLLQLARQSLLRETGTAAETTTEFRGLASHELLLSSHGVLCQKSVDGTVQVIVPSSAGVAARSR